MGVSVAVQVDAELQKQAAKILNEQGTSVDDAVELLLKRVVRDGALVLQSGEDPEYDAWVAAKVQEALEDTRPTIPHEQVMERWAKRRQELLAKTR